MQNSGEIDQPAIIVVGFARAASLARLLKSINNAELPPGVQLLISLDGGASADTVATAREFVFTHGVKDVELHSQNLGLREHILWVGDQTGKYGSIVVLEDDILADRYFYHYAVSAIRSYDSDANIAGVALYSPRANENAHLAFEPLVNNFSSYFMQIPCSWGQAWTRSQWSNFRDWYDEFATTNALADIDIPQSVKEWPESSWKKYFAAYLVHRDKYFSYPYRSYATNCADAGGSHVKESSTFYQVPLADQSRPLETFNHDAFSVDGIVYDAYMEPNPRRLSKILGVPPDELAVDTYGCKPRELLRKKKFALTTKRCSETIGATYLTLKPVEQNLCFAGQPLSQKVAWSGFRPILTLAESQHVVENKAKFIRLSQYHSYQRPHLSLFGLQYFLMLTRKLIGRLRRLL
ncbi:MAG: hypothetical protein KJO27_02760 [Gammaproteobacteria bacterium]|nr:hypothetical protein [Gammaproteobacteria bacterium]NND47622.1 hypothetical protein [Woeseiaceae bacterium]NNL44329.1 hypothetical protein [Woeseiaceae bacterium]